MSEATKTTKPMSDDEYAARMNEIAGGDDTECDHGNADDLLCEILRAIGGFEKTLAAYESVHKWYA